MDTAPLLWFDLAYITSSFLLDPLHICSLVVLLELGGLQVLSFDTLLLWSEANRDLLDGSLVVEWADFNLRTEGLQLVLLLNLNCNVVLVGGMRFSGCAYLNVVIVCLHGEIRKAQNFHDLCRFFEGQVDAILEFVFD